jgi:glucosamine-6-phosphate deaminase
MRVILLSDPAAVASRAADFVSRLVRKKPACVLGLATGSTPLGLYRELIRLHRECGLDFSRVTTFNLDEYIGLGPDDPQSYRQFMQTNLFDHLNIPREQTHVPDGLARDLADYGGRYESLIRAAGGIDVQVLGIGADGHIGFNEPGSSLGSRTRVKSLARETVRDNARFFGGEERVPRLAITMGVGTILDARQCLLLATGPSKAQAIRDTIEGPLTSQITASALQLHPDTVCILDESAAAMLLRKDYYRDSEAAQQSSEQSRLS